MKFRRLSLVVLASLCGAACEAEASPHWAADVPLESCDGIPCIEATAGHGASGRYVIDTGDILSIVDNADANAIGVDPARIKDNLVRKEARTTVTIAHAQLSGVLFMAFALADNIEKGLIPHSRGSLAYTAFDDRVIQLDFVHHRFRVSDPIASAAPCAGHCAKLDLVKFGKNGPPVLVGEGFSANGHSIRAQVDTLYTGGLLIYTASIKPLGFSVPAGAPQVAFPFTDGGVSMLQGGDGELGFVGERLGRVPLCFPTPGVHEPDGFFEGTIGLAGLAETVLTIDLHSRTVGLERPKSR